MGKENLFNYERRQRPKFSNTTADKIELNTGLSVGYAAQDKGRGKPNRAYLTKRRRSGNKNHYSKVHDGFPLSITVLEKCRSYNINEILIIDEDSGEVFEFSLNDYLHGTELDRVYEGCLCVPLNSRRHEWHAEDILQ